MAIEDGYQLSLTLDEAVHSVQPGAPVDIEGALRKYQSVSSVMKGHANKMSLPCFLLQDRAHVISFCRTSCMVEFALWLHARHLHSCCPCDR